MTAYECSKAGGLHLGPVVTVASMAGIFTRIYAEIIEVSAFFCAGE